MFHPHAKLDFVYSTTNAGKPLSIAHHDLMGDIEMNFTDTVNPVNVVFLCLGMVNQYHFKRKSVCQSY
jgi:N-acetyl-gamma-glutamyl-phosphate reductase